MTTGTANVDITYLGDLEQNLSKWVRGVDVIGKNRERGGPAAYQSSDQFVEVDWPIDYDFELISVIHIKDYQVVFNPNVSWLLSVTQRIEDSVAPNDNIVNDEPAGWLNAGAASAAKIFFKNAADLLPTEPHIYASSAGDVVAEFEGALGHLTCVISNEETVFFGVLEDDRLNPVQGLIRRGSNQFRTELRQITSRFLPRM